MENSTNGTILNIEVKTLFPINKCPISILVPSNNKPKLVQILCTMKLYDTKTSVPHVYNVLFNHGSGYTSPFLFNGLFQVCIGVKLPPAAVNGSGKCTHTVSMELRS